MVTHNDQTASSNSRQNSDGAPVGKSASTGNLSLNTDRGSNAREDANNSSSPSSSDNSSPPDAVKNPDEWVTGDESMTGAQASYLKTLTHEAGEEMDETLSKAEASKRIDELQAQTGRGRNH